MGYILMCKDKAVYDIDNNLILDNKLVPGYIKNKSNDIDRYRKWLKLRRYESSNSIAKNLFNKTPKEYTYNLSLSDCYWVKLDTDKTKFNSITPYLNTFWKGEDYYQWQSIPTLYVPGCLNKYWVDSNTLYKTGENVQIEAECSRVCVACSILVNDVIQKDANSILIKNITNTEYMLEQADQSGLIDADKFDNTDIVKHFGISGIQMIVIDAIFGNGDRHAGNFGWLRDTDTGDYVCMAPLYDFDHALDSKLKLDILIKDAVEICLTDSKYINEALRIANKVIHLNTLETFRLRAFSLIEQINKRL